MEYDLCSSTTRTREYEESQMSTQTILTGAATAAG